MARRKHEKILPLIGIVFSLFSFALNKSLAQICSSDQSILDTTSNEIIVRLRPGGTKVEFQALTERLGAVFVAPIFLPTTPAGRNPKLSCIYLVRFPTGWRIEPVIQRYKRNRLIETVEPNRLSRLLGERTIPNDPRFLEQWNMQSINIPAAWSVERGDPSVIIAVVDSGGDLTHEDLRSQLWSNPHEISDNGRDDDHNGYVDDIRGWDFSDAPMLPGRGDYTNRDNDPSDETGHGTHVSGIIGASGNNSIGIAGIAWRCRLMLLRAGFVVSTGGAFLQNDDAAAAIVYAADNGAKVINMSWGDTVDAFVIRDAVEYAYHRGCVLVGAAGNSHSAGALYPAALKTVIAVAATGQDNTLAFVSNFGASIDIAAPGEAILSSQLGDTYGLLAGTSMAAPHVSGVAALLLSHRPELTNADVRRILVVTATPTRSNQLIDTGLVDADAALRALVNLTARLIAPENFSGGDGEIEISGTAGGSGFLTYRLEFGRTEMPDRWFPIGGLQQHPKFSEILGRWNIFSLAEGIYTIRLTVVGADRTTVRDKVVLWVDHSPPEISEHQADLWLSGDRFDTMVSWHTDDFTDGTISIFQGLDARIQTESTRRHHIVNLSDRTIPPGTYEYRLSVQNRAGTITVGKSHNLRITYQRIPPHRLQIETTHPLPLHVAGVSDFDLNGRLELVATELGGAGYAATQVIERENTGVYRSIFSTAEAFLPWEIGDTDGDGLIEVLGNRNEQTFLVEQRVPGGFPTELIWEINGIWGGQIEDLDGDGRPEIISRHNATNAIWIYETIENNRYRRVAILDNPTEGENRIGTTFAIEDFDGDRKLEIVAGDGEGDLFIYEVVANDQYRPTWVGKIKARNAHNLAAGVLRSDGTPEFVVSGQSAGDRFDLPEQHWIFAIFKSVGDDSYEAVWTQGIRGVQSSGNGMTVADTNDDGRDEIAIAVCPNFYLIEYTGADYTSVWYHSASSTFRPIVADIDGDGRNELMFNDADAFTVFGPSADRRFPLTPWGVVATPRDESSIHLRWQSFRHASYTVYRGISENALDVLKTGIPHVSLKDEIFPVVSFIDEGLQTGRTYWYAVAAHDTVGNLSERSLLVSVTPTAPPRLISVEYVDPDRILLYFDKRMGTSAAQSSRYRLEESPSTTFRQPRSMLLDQSRRRAVATFEPGILRPLEAYEISVKNLHDVNGTPIAADANALTLIVPRPSQITNLSAAIVYPNPVRGARVIFDRLPAEAKIQIYDVAGSQIAVLVLAPIDRGRKAWNLRQLDPAISSGVYIYVLEAEGERRMGKLSVIR